ncbi:MAG: TraR/DksA C4-type zinc finger protein [Ignavibacteriae bacterium]|nr:TraR/DksA C4-type zinc finger protein [Ignavibacteria bacterium]MBI3364649.1 TraR/DksA C4-type zinc finger protein [Ignavibacteriota bacterium]
MAKMKKTTAGATKSMTATKMKTMDTPKAKVRAKTAKPEKTKSPVRKTGYTKQELQYFKNIILEKKKEILEELETLRDSMMDTTTGEYASENSTYSTHMEQGTDAMEREKTFLFASREGKFLNHLEDALQRIGRGDYGRCTMCGKLIEKERLEAVPHAQQCLQCKLHSGK